MKEIVSNFESNFDITEMEIEQLRDIAAIFALTARKIIPSPAQLLFVKSHLSYIFEDDQVCNFTFLQI